MKSLARFATPLLLALVAAACDASDGPDEADAGTTPVDAGSATSDGGSSGSDGGQPQTDGGGGSDGGGTDPDMGAGDGGTGNMDGGGSTEDGGGSSNPDGGGSGDGGGTGNPDGGDAGTGVDGGTVDTGTPDMGTNAAPVISTFLGQITSASFQVRYDWSISDPDGDPLTCTLDSGEAGSTPYMLSSCTQMGSQLHSYAASGRYTARLTVSDGVLQTDATFVIDPNPISFDVRIANGPVVPDGRLIYVLTVGNRTEADIADAAVDFFVPANLFFYAGRNAAPNANCGSNSCGATQPARWSLGTLLAGSTRTIMVDALVSTPLANGTNISLTANFGATNLSSLQMTRTATVVTSVVAQLGLDASQDPVTPGESFTLTVDAGNLGGADITGATLELRLPEGLSATSASHGGTASGGWVRWSSTAVEHGQAERRTVQVTADSGLFGGDVLPMSVELLDGSGAVLARAEHVVTVNDAPPPLAVEVTRAIEPMSPGGRGLFTITVSNISSNPVTNAGVLVRTPLLLSSHYAGRDAQPNTNCSSSSAFCDPTYESWWDLGSLVSGESRTITLNLPMGATAPDGALMRLLISAYGDQMRDIPVYMPSTAVRTAPAHELGLFASADPVVAGESYVLTAVLGNASPSAISNASLRLALPSGTTGGTPSHGGMLSSGVVDWNIGTLVPGEVVRRTLTVTTDSGIDAGSILEAQLETSYDLTTGQSRWGRTAHAVTIVDTTPPLTVAIAARADPAVPGGRVQYTLTVGNVSTQSVTGVTVQQRVPEEFDYYYAGRHAQPNASCGPNYCESDYESNWDLGTVAAGESRTITFDSAIDATTPDGALISLPVRVEADGLHDVIDRLHVIGLTSTPDAELYLSASTDPAVSGESFELFVDVGAIGNGNLPSADLELTLPSGLSPQSASSGGMISGQQVTWSLNSGGTNALSAGDSMRRSVTVTAGSLPSASNLTAIAELSYTGGWEVDHRSEYTLSSATQALPLRFEFARALDPVAAGGRVLHTLTLGNTSGQALADLSVLVRIPAEYSWVYSTDAIPNTNCGGTYCNPTHESVWNIGSLAAGAHQTILLDANTSATAIGGDLIDLPIRITATGLGDDIDLRAVSSVDGFPQAELVLTASEDPATAGGSVTFTAMVGNPGTTSISPTLQLDVPEGSTVSSASTGGMATGGTTQWTLGTVAPGTVVSRSVTVTLPSTLSVGDVVQANARLIHGALPEVNHRAAVNVKIVSSAQTPPIQLTVSTSPATASSGSALLYTFALTNTSARPVEGVAFVVQIPNEVNFVYSSDVSPINAACGGTYCQPGGESTFTVGRLNPGQTQNVTVNASITGTAGSIIEWPVWLYGTGWDEMRNVVFATPLQ